MAKNEQKIKFEADVSSFKSNIKEAQKSIKTLNNELKLNREQLKGNEKDTTLLSDRIESLKKKYEEQSKIVENTRLSYEKAVEILGENSAEANNLKNKLLQEETALQKVKNELSEANKQLDAQTNKLKITGKEWEESGKRLQEYGKKIESIGNKLSIVSGAIGGIAVASLKSSIDFESAFTGVTKTVDGTEEQLASLRKEILELSTKLPSSASEIAKVAESAGQLGIATEDIMSFTKVMIDLGNSTNISADEASTSLAKFANITKMSAKDYDRLGSTIVDLGNNFATTEADIIAMGQNLASAGTQVGMTQSDIMALATALSSVGLEAQAGGTAFSKALISMQLAVETNSEDLKKWADVAGMSVSEFSDLFKNDATSALEAFIKGLAECGGETDSAIKVLDDMGITETRLRDSLLRSANASDTFSKAIKLGSKAWKENTALTKEANKRYGSTESQMKKLKNEVQKTAIEFGDELAPSLRKVVKDAKPMLNSISTAIKSFANLDKETKNTILRIGALTLAAGPAIKLAGSTITTIGSVKSGLGTLAGAIGVLKGSEEGATKEAISLASSISKLASPTGLAIAAITAGVAGIIKLTEASRKSREAQEAEVKATKDSLDATKEKISVIEAERKTIEDSMNSKLSELDYNKQLFNELQTIVDENGKVKEGYESRAKFITEQLSGALGTEIEMNGNVVNSYKDIQREITLTILKKQAEAKYEETQSKAIEARKREKELIIEVGEKQEALNQKEKEYNDTYNERVEYYRDLLGLNNEIGKAKMSAETIELLEKQAIEDAAKDTKYLSEEISNMTNEVNSLNSEIKTEANNQREATQVAELWAEGSEESLNKIINLTQRTITINGETRKTDLKEEILYWQQKIAENKEAYAEALKNNDEYNQKLTANSEELYKQQLLDTIEQLKSITSVTEENSPEVVEAWKQMSKDSYDVFFDVVSQYPPELRDKIVEMTGVTLEQTPELTSATQTMMDEVLNTMNQDPKFKTEAIGNLKAFLNGLNDEQLRAMLETAGINDVEAVMKGIRSGNLSEDEGMKILSGLKDGLNNSSLTSQLFGVARNLSNKLSSMLTVSAKINASSIPGHKSGLDYVPYDNYIARLHKGERVLTAQENKDYMTSNLENKIANRSLVVQFFPQKMDESELQRAENYISRKWGLSL